MSVLGILEDVLQTHPAVAEAAIVASPDERLGEVPKAFVVLRRVASPRELIAWVADQVAPYPRIRRVEFVERLPKSSDGKILHGLLAARERAAFTTSDIERSLPSPQPQRTAAGRLSGGDSFSRRAGATEVLNLSSARRDRGAKPFPLWG
jgi:hypothetical protein